MFARTLMVPAAEILILRFNSFTGNSGGMLHNMSPVFYAQFSQKSIACEKLTDILLINLLK